MVKGGTRFCRAGLLGVVVKTGIGVDSVSRLERRIRVVSPCSGQRMCIAVDD